MALSLRAEQKSILNLFNNGEDIYVIPKYQRPYSWNKDTCYQFYSDITSAFLQDKDYFVGNIIMARSDDEEKKKPNIVDGQQRLITLWLFVKVLTVLHPEKTRLARLLQVESVLSDKSVPRIWSKVYEHVDQENIKTVLKYDRQHFEYEWSSHLKNKYDLDELKISRIEANALYIYKWLKEFYDNIGDSEQQVRFLNFFLERVYLLPIELNGRDMVEASDRALTIFETINNRGQLLEDSDIFKARLYKSAEAEGKGRDFIDQWLDFNSTCEELHMSVDDLFRYYYHILRGKEGVTTNEGSLREYLTRDSNSALSVKPYKEVISDLSAICTILQWLNDMDKMPVEFAQLIQLIGLYTNQYPKYALVNYLFTEGLATDENLLFFLKNIVRYYYFRGATMQVKYETYRINKLIANHKKIEKYDCSSFDVTTLEHLGYLKNGYALLAHYLLYPSEYNRHVYFDKVVNRRDWEELPIEWGKVMYEFVNNDIANIVVLDTPKKSLGVKAKAEYYAKSQFQDVRDIFDEDGNLPLKRFYGREEKLKQILMDYFKK